MNLESVSREEWTFGGLAVLLIIDLVALPWYSASFGAFSASVTGTDSPDSFAGVIALLGAIALVAWLLVTRLAPQVQLPTVGGSAATTKLVLVAIAAGFTVLKLLLQIGHLGDWDFGFWAGLVLAGGLVWFGLQGRASA